jgi:two-component system nitrate/nitrite response regulator NarL
MFGQQLQPIRILLIDDHAILRAGLRLIIESQATMRVVGEAEDSATALALAAEQRPDIILLDLDLGSDSGLHLLPAILDSAPESRAIVLTGLRDVEAHRQAVLLGAMGLVLKEKAIETLIKAIEKVHAGEVWLDRSMIATVLNTRAREHATQDSNAHSTRIATLTDREREVVCLIGEGLRNKDIATRLVISEATVRNHLTSIFAKLGVENRYELVVFAYRNGLAGPPK